MNGKVKRQCSWCYVDLNRQCKSIRLPFIVRSIGFLVFASFGLLFSRSIAHKCYTLQKFNSILRMFCDLIAIWPMTYGNISNTVENSDVDYISINMNTPLMENGCLVLRLKRSGARERMKTTRNHQESVISNENRFAFR